MLRSLFPRSEFEIKGFLTIGEYLEALEDNKLPQNVPILPIAPQEYRKHSKSCGCKDCHHIYYEEVMFRRTIKRFLLPCDALYEEILVGMLGAYIILYPLLHLKF